MRHLNQTTEDIGRRILRAADRLQDDRNAAGSSPLDIDNHVLELRSIARGCFRNADREIPEEADNPPTAREDMKGWKGDPELLKGIAEYHGIGEGTEPDPNLPEIRGEPRAAAAMCEMVGLSTEEAPDTGPEEVRGSPDLVRAHLESFPEQLEKQEARDRRAEERAREREARAANRGEPVAVAEPARSVTVPVPPAMQPPRLKGQIRVGEHPREERIEE